MVEFIGSFMKKNKSLFFVFIGFILIPICIQMHWWPLYQVVIFLTPGNHDTWTQFWGSYLGFVPSGFVAYFVLKLQFEKQSNVDKSNFKEQLENQKQEFLFEQDYSELSNLQSLTIENYWQFKQFSEVIDNGTTRATLNSDWKEAWNGTIYNRSKITIWNDAFKQNTGSHHEDSVSTLLINIGEDVDSFNRNISSQPNNSIDFGEALLLKETIENICDSYLKIYTILTRLKIEMKENLSA